MKELIARMWKGLKKIFVAFTPPLITVGVTILAISYFNFWPTNQVIQQAKIDIISLDVISQVSEKAIQASNNVVEMMKWIMVTFLITGATVFWRLEKDITQKLDQIQKNRDLINDTLVKTDKQLNDLSTHYHNLQQDLYNLPSRILPFEMAVAAYEAGKITDTDLLESQAWFSWQKWYFADNPTGYEELLAYKESKEGLPSSVVRTAITVLVELIGKKKRPGAFNTKDEDRKSKLLELLNLESQP